MYRFSELLMRDLMEMIVSRAVSLLDGILYIDIISGSTHLGMGNNSSDGVLDTSLLTA